MSTTTRCETIRPSLWLLCFLLVFAVVRVLVCCGGGNTTRVLLLVVVVLFLDFAVLRIVRPRQSSVGHKGGASGLFSDDGSLLLLNIRS